MPDDEPIIELPAVLRIPIARLRGISLIPEEKAGPGAGWIEPVMPLAERIPLEELFAVELARHTRMILYRDVEGDEMSGTTREDSGGLKCSCGEWEHEQVGYLRPQAQFHRHVADALVALVPAPSAEG